MIVIDSSNRMARLISYRKMNTTTYTAQFYMPDVVRIHGIPECIYTDRDTQFTSKFWKQMWGLFWTRLIYSIAFHSPTQRIVERMNAIVVQMIRCTFRRMNESK